MLLSPTPPAVTLLISAEGTSIVCSYMTQIKPLSLCQTGGVCVYMCVYEYVCVHTVCAWLSAC